ncbi:MAG TPA: hypothetical protein VFL31_05035 [Nitrospiraceae bacterium]|nr:hypothetical protein [Nitrospiraceae bacterium]
MGNSPTLSWYSLKALRAEARAFVVLTLAVLITSSVPVLAQTDPYLMGNSRFGQWYIGEEAQVAVAEAKSRFGTFQSFDVRLNLNPPQTALAHFWSADGFRLVVFQDKVIQVMIWRRYRRVSGKWQLIQDKNAVLAQFRTPEGIRVGEGLTSVTAAYGAPDYQKRRDWGEPFINTLLVWYDRGLLIEISTPDSAVDGLGISDPAIARQQYR